MASMEGALADIKRGYEQQRTSGAYDHQLNEFMANEVVPVWKANAPVDTGNYRDSIKVTKRASSGKGEVGATDSEANLVEYGSKNNPEYAPRAKTEAHFNQPGPIAL